MNTETKTSKTGTNLLYISNLVPFFKQMLRWKILKTSKLLPETFLIMYNDDFSFSLFVFLKNTKKNKKAK